MLFDGRFALSVKTIIVDGRFALSVKTVIVDRHFARTAPRQARDKAHCVRMDGPRILADAGPTQVGAALSMEACADGAHSWTLKRLSHGGSGISDYLGVCVGAACICLSATPTSGSFNGFVVGFRATANVDHRKPRFEHARGA